MDLEFTSDEPFLSELKSEPSLPFELKPKSKSTWAFNSARAAPKSSYTPRSSLVIDAMNDSSWEMDGDSDGDGNGEGDGDGETITILSAGTLRLISGRGDR